MISFAKSQKIIGILFVFAIIGSLFASDCKSFTAMKKEVYDTNENDVVDLAEEITADIQAPLISDLRNVNDEMARNLLLPSLNCTESSVTLATGANYIHGCILAKGKIYAGTRTDPAKLIVFNDLDNLNDYTIFTFPSDGQHDKAESIVYSREKDLIYVGFDSTSNGANVSSFDPDDGVSTHTLFIDDGEGVGIDVGYSYGMATDESYLYLTSNEIGTSSAMFKYDLDNSLSISYTALTYRSGHALVYDGNKLYATGQSSPGWIARINPSTLVVEEEEQFDTGENTVTDDIIDVGDYIWLGLEGGTGKFYKIRKDDLTDQTLIDLGASFDTYSAEFDGKYIWTASSGSPSTIYRIDPCTHEVWKFTTAQNVVNTILSDGSRLFYTTWGTPSTIHRVTAPELTYYSGGSGSAGGGDVSTSGTPVDNDFAKFVDGTDIEGRSYAEVRSDLDLEAGTDFYSVSGADSAFEAELNNSAGLLSALSDETGSGLAVFGTAPNMAHLMIENDSASANHGIYIEDATGGLTMNVGLVIEGADLYAMWIGSGGNYTDAANGITFGSSYDVNLYRGGVNQLKTDDSLDVGINLDVGGDIYTEGAMDIGDTLTVSDVIYALEGAVLGANKRLSTWTYGSSLIADDLIAIHYDGYDDYTNANEQDGLVSNSYYANLAGDYNWGVHVNADSTSDGGKDFLAGMHGTNNVGIQMASGDNTNTATFIQGYQWGTTGNASQNIIDLNMAYDWRSGGSASGSFTGDFLDFTNYDINRYRVDNLGQVYCYDIDGDGSNYGVLKCSDNNAYLQASSGSVVLQPASGGSNYIISHSDSAGIFPLNDSTQVLGASGFEWGTAYINNIRSDTGGVDFGDEDIVTTGTITTGGYTFPSADGSANQVIKTNGSGALSWTSSTGSGAVTPTNEGGYLDGTLSISNSLSVDENLIVGGFIAQDTDFADFPLSFNLSTTEGSGSTTEYMYGTIAPFDMYVETAQVISDVEPTGTLTVAVYEETSDISSTDPTTSSSNRVGTAQTINTLVDSGHFLGFKLVGATVYADLENTGIVRIKYERRTES